MNIMLDLETMGTSPGSAVIAIGAVAFDSVSVTGTFYQRISLSDCVARGLAIDPATVTWWLKQSDEARMEFVKPGCIKLLAALDYFTDFYNGVNGCEMWGNGSDFDNVVLAAAYKAARLNVPWKFWDNRCYRTMKNLHRDVPFQRVGTHHNAVDDARSQAEHLIAIADHSGVVL